MPVHSGKFGLIDGIPTCRTWSINEVGETKPYVASNTQGGTGRKMGNQDWNGNFGAYGGMPAVMPGEYFDFAGYTAPADDQWGGDGALYEGTAIVDQVTMVWNWTTADILSYTANFSGHGPVTQDASATAPEDVTFPDCPSIIGETPMWGTVDAASGAFVELEDVQQITLNITKNNQAYVNSSTNGWNFRKPGNLDFNAAIVFHNDAGVNMPFAKGDVVGLLLPAPGQANPWHIQWFIVKDFTGITVDREGAALISCTANLEMAGFDHENEEVGFVILPDGTQYWPAAGS